MDQERVDHIIGAIQQVSFIGWYALGIACGHSSDEIDQIHQLVQDAYKMLKLFSMIFDMASGCAADQERVDHIIGAIQRVTSASSTAPSPLLARPLRGAVQKTILYPYNMEYVIAICCSSFSSHVMSAALLAVFLKQWNKVER